MTNIVPERAPKGNNWLQAGLLAAMVVLVGVACFGLGRLSAAGQGGQQGIVIHPPGDGK